MPERTYVDRKTGETRTLPGGVLRRPFALKACERRAYQEAKAIYMQGASKGSIDGITLVDAPRAFRDLAVDSIKAQPENPT